MPLHARTRRGAFFAALRPSPPAPGQFPQTATAGILRRAHGRHGHHARPTGAALPALQLLPAHGAPLACCCCALAITHLSSSTKSRNGRRARRPDSLPSRLDSRHCTRTRPRWQSTTRLPQSRATSLRASFLRNPPVPLLHRRLCDLPQVNWMQSLASEV